MDLRLLIRVLWRFRLLVLSGFCVALSLTFLSLVRVDPGGSPLLSYRGSETWTSSSQLFITEPGFPWGRRLVSPVDGSESTTSAQSDPGRLTSLAVLYATFADSDPVKRIMLRGGKMRGKVSASPLLTGADGQPLPIIEVSASGSSQRAAIVNTRRASDALVTFIRSQQEVNDIPEDDRVVIQTIEAPLTAKLLAGRPKVIPILMFLVVMAMVIGLALVLENIRPVATSADGEVEPATRLRRPA